MTLSGAGSLGLPHPAPLSLSLLKSSKKGGIYFGMAVENSAEGEVALFGNVRAAERRFLAQTCTKAAQGC